MTGETTAPWHLAVALAFGLTVVGLAAGSVVAVGGPAVDGSGSSTGVAGDTTVRLEPSSATIDEGANRTLAVVVPRAEGGVGAISGRITVVESEHAEIVDFAFTGDPGVRNVTSDGETVSFEAAIMDTPQTGRVTVAEVTVQGRREGTTDLALSVEALGDEAGDPYDVGGTPDTALTVNGTRATVPLEVVAYADRVAAGESVTFAVRRADSGARVEANLTVGNRTVETGVDGRATVTIRESMIAADGTVTAVASKDPTGQEQYLDDTVILSTGSRTGTGDTDTEGTATGNVSGVLVRTDPANTGIAPGGTATVDVVVANADGGVGAGNLTVRVADPSVASITNASLVGDPGIGEATVTGGGAAVRAEFALRDGGDGSRDGPVRVLRLTLRGADSGSTALSITAPSLGDEDGNSYTVAATPSGSVTVAAGAAGTGTSTAESGGTTSEAASPTDGGSDSDQGAPGGRTTTAGGPGFGPVMALVALLVLGGWLVDRRP